MPLQESKEAIAKRHVERGRAIIAQQWDLIQQLKARGTNTDRSEALLNTFLATQEIFEQDLARIENR